MGHSVVNLKHIRKLKLKKLEVEKPHKIFMMQNLFTPLCKCKSMAADWFIGLLINWHWNISSEAEVFYTSAEICLSYYLSFDLPDSEHVCLCLSVSVCLSLYIYLYVCLSLYVWLCLCTSVSGSVCLSGCLCQSLPVPVLLPICHCICMCLHRSVYLSPYMTLSVYLYLCLYLSVSVCFCLSLSFSLSASVCLSVALSLSVFVFISICFYLNVFASVTVCLYAISAVIVFKIRVRQMGQMRNLVAHWSQLTRWPQGRKTTLTSVSKQILHVHSGVSSRSSPSSNVTGVSPETQKRDMWTEAV